MPIATLTIEQVDTFVRQLPPDQKRLLLGRLLLDQWAVWVELSEYGQERARFVAAQRGRNWDLMTEEERETLVDDLVHEGR